MRNASRARHGRPSGMSMSLRHSTWGRRLLGQTASRMLAERAPMQHAAFEVGAGRARPLEHAERGRASA